MYTDIIVGAGSAGCVLANRLSADPDRTVLLLEAGEFYRSAETPPEVASPNNFTVLSAGRFLWPLVAQLTADQRDVPYQQGRGVGGSSAVNNGWAVRCRPGDLDRWHATGCTALGWDELMQHYCAIEDDLDFGAEPIHGDRGPIVVSRLDEASWSAADLAFREACVARGMAESPDLNAPASTGVSPMAMTLRDDRRVSAHDAFLDPVVDRPNLTIESGVLVERVGLDGSRATGVVVNRRGVLEEVSAKNVILAAGAVQSPTLLLRSGVGPADAMRACGVEQRHRLDAVGRNLVEHPMVALFFPVVEEAQPPSIEARQANVLARPEGGASGDPWHLSCLSLTPMGGTFASPFVTLMDVASRGRVALAADGTSLMRVEALSEPADVERLWEGFERLLDLLDARPMRALAAGPMLAPGGPLDLDAARADRGGFLRRSLLPYRHLAGTCRMSDRPEDGVVDGSHRVHGLENLFVVDASVLPDATSSNLNLTVMAVAHRAAEHFPVR